MDKKRNNNIDIIKGFSSMCILLIHCKYPGNIGSYIKAINRFSVPYFFFVSGYYFLKNDDIQLIRIFLKILHIFKLILNSAIFYLIFTIIFNNILYSYDWNIGYYFLRIVTKGKLIKFFISNDPFKYRHLWFLLALLYCYILLFILKIINTKIIINNLFIVLIIYLGVIGYIILGEFSGLKLIKNIYKFKSGYCILTYNLFLFRALPFLMLGLFFRINKIQINLTFKKYIFIFIIGLILSCIEYNIVKKSLNTYISTFIQIFSLIGFSLSNKEIKNIIVSYIGRQLSLKIYIYHIAIIKIVDLIIIRLKLYYLRSFQSLIVLILTLVLCIFLETISQILSKINKIKIIKQ